MLKTYIIHKQFSPQVADIHWTVRLICGLVGLLICQFFPVYLILRQWHMDYKCHFFVVVQSDSFYASICLCCVLFFYLQILICYITWVAKMQCRPYVGRTNLILLGRPYTLVMRYNFRLWSRISPERIEVSKIGSTTTRPTLSEQVGKLWSTNKKLIGAHVDSHKISTACPV